VGVSAVEWVETEDSSSGFSRKPENKTNAGRARILAAALRFSGEAAPTDAAG
jgi:hypothetical protein